MPHPRRQTKDRVAEFFARHVKERYGEEVPVSTLPPPGVEMGDVGIPVAFELAKRLRRKPRELAEEIKKDVEKAGGVAGLSRIEVAGAGYLNAFYRRSQYLQALREDLSLPPRGAGPDAPKVVIEHTNINPNKAAHVGHLRNAILGDTLARLLLHEGARRVEVQNYIDDTGVQVADVVVGFAVLRGMDLAAVRSLPPATFDKYCWDLYAEVGRWYEEDASRLEHRRRALHEMESGEGALAEVGRTVAETILSCHLRTMRRCGVGYDLLTKESDVLGFRLWDTAFARMKESGAVAICEEGKNRGCWVMALSDSPEFAGLEDADKVLVRSDGTVTYTGKDIAYQMWKFGLLGRDFAYARRAPLPGEGGEADAAPPEPVWTTTTGASDPGAPRFGHADWVYNVIDVRQSYLQKIVKESLRLLGHPEAADRSVHFAYETVGLSRKAAEALGMAPEAGEDDGKKGTIGMSGRKGIGVQADELLDTLEKRAREEVAAREPELGPRERDARARAISLAALRYFMLKFGRTKIISFDFDEALQFEGETGPYLQYSVVRARNILRRLEAERGEGLEVVEGRFRESVFPFLEDPEAGNDLWDFVRSVGTLDDAVEAALRSEDPAGLAKFVFGMAQKFSNFYHRHPILREEDRDIRLDRAALVRLYLLQMERALDLLGIPVPDRM